MQGRVQGFGSEGMGSGGAGGFQPPPQSCGGNGMGGGAGAGEPPPGFVPKIESGRYSTGNMQGFGNPNFTSKEAEGAHACARARPMRVGGFPAPAP